MTPPTASSSLLSRRLRSLAQILGLCLLVALHSCGGEPRKKKSGGSGNAAPAGNSDATGGGKPSNSIDASGRAGNAPDRPAPPITAAIFAECDEYFAEAKAHYNDAQRARKDGNESKRTEEAKAGSNRIRDIKDLLEVQLGWHEEAGLEDWAIPSSYVTLEKKFEEWQTMERRLQMMGGK